MRILIAAALLAGSSSLYPSLAQEPAKPQPELPSTAAPARPDQNAEQPRDQRAGRDASRADNREMGQDWRLRRGDGERADRDREMGFDGRRDEGWRHGAEDREIYRDPGMRRERDARRNWDRGRYSERDGNRAYGDNGDRSYFDDDRPQRRIKICVEYENGDEYCRYKR